MPREGKERSIADYKEKKRPRAHADRHLRASDVLTSFGKAGCMHLINLCSCVQMHSSHPAAPCGDIKHDGKNDKTDKSAQGSTKVVSVVLGATVTRPSWRNLAS
jgi:hypothetical protein